jgi:hypothetical protein
VDLASQDLREVEVLLLLRAVGHECGGDRVDGEHGDRGPGAHRLVEEQELLDRAAALTAVLGGPTDAQPAVATHLDDDVAHGRAYALAVGHLLLDLGREQFVVVGPQLAAESLVFLGVPDVHGSPPGGTGLTPD